jgi:glycerol-3-phosphate dehydrogenase
MARAVEARRAQLERLAGHHWDLLVVGGGVTGAGVLLDAVSRGFDAALIEADDFAVGTSGRSTRLIHGGLRYLEHMQLRLIREALAERRVLLRIAPHLVHLSEWLFPIYGGPLSPPFYGSGFLLYDLLGAASDGGRHRHLGVAESLARTPVLRRRGLRGSLVYHDAQVDDARYVITLVRTAQARGALALNRVTAVGPMENGRHLVGVTAQDVLTRTGFGISARWVVDATGAWSGLPDGPFPVTPSRSHVLPSRGSHLVVPRERIRSTCGLTLRIPGRVCFAVPWPNVWIVGTTDLPDPGPPRRPAISSVEVDSILHNLNASLDVGLTRADVVAAYTGIRPLAVEPGVAAGSTVRVSREHRIRTDPNGLVRISGGKFTTYRLMAEQTVDVVMGGRARQRRSGTRDLALLGAMPSADLDALADRLPGEGGIESLQARTLVGRYGSEAAHLVQLGRQLDLLRELHGAPGHVEAEVVWAVRHEQALSVDDVLARRLRIAQETHDHGAAAARRVTELMSGELGWSAAQQARSASDFIGGATREYGLPPGPVPVVDVVSRQRVI